MGDRFTHVPPPASLLTPAHVQQPRANHGVCMFYVSVRDEYEVRVFACSYWGHVLHLLDLRPTTHTTTFSRSNRYITMMDFDTMCRQIFKRKWWSDRGVLLSRARSINCFLIYCSINCLSHFSSKNTNVLWFELLKCEGLLLFFILVSCFTVNVCRNICRFWTVGEVKTSADENNLQVNW